MKHYFWPHNSLDWSKVAIFSPVSGKIVQVRQEWAGVQIEIKATENGAFRVVLFHIIASIPLDTGINLVAGQRLGTHVHNQTFSDVAIAVNSTLGHRYVSWFDAVSDDLMASYQAKGIVSREAMIISRAERDASPLTCDSGGTFASTGSLASWVALQ